MTADRRATDSPAIDTGLAMADKLFEKRPGNVELHLSKWKLAVILAAAYDLGREAGRKERR